MISGHQTPRIFRRKLLSSVCTLVWRVAHVSAALKEIALTFVLNILILFSSEGMPTFQMFFK
jgi:hypothetical protein